MKNILIVFTGAMELGGIERSLLGFLDAIDYEKYSVDLFLYAHHGTWYSLINHNVNLLPEVRELAYLRESFFTKIRHGCFYSAACRFKDQLKYKNGRIPHYLTWADIMRKKVPALDKEYDLAIGFFRPFDFIKEKVKAKVRIGWVHTDYSSCDKNQTDEIRKDFAGLDYIAAVSEKCKDTFCSQFPEYSDKCIVVENVLSETFVRSQAEATNVTDEMPIDGNVRLLSVGRFSKAKNFDNIPDICRKIIESGINVKWYIIGYGSDESLIFDKIKEAGMEKQVIMLGRKDNPYPYMNACDFYIQPSRYEGKCVAVREAQMLGKPVIITNYPTSGSQVKNGEDGVIVPLENEGCAQGIIETIRNTDLISHILWTERKTDYSNIKEVERILKFAE